MSSGTDTTAPKLSNELYVHFFINSSPSFLIQVLQCNWFATLQIDISLYCCRMDMLLQMYLATFHVGMFDILCLCVDCRQIDQTFLVTHLRSSKQRTIPICNCVLLLQYLLIFLTWSVFAPHRKFKKNKILKVFVKLYKSCLWPITDIL